MARDVPEKFDSGRALLVPRFELSEQVGGEGRRGGQTHTSREDLIEQLPIDVQGAIRLRPEYLSRLLAGETIIHNDSTGVGERTISISKGGVELVSHTRDA